MIDLRTEFIAWYFNEFKFDPLYQLMDGMAEESPWHRESSIGVHTNMVVAQYISRVSLWNTNSLCGAFATAFHDVGKPSSCEIKFKPERGNYKSFNGHELVSARLWENWAVKNWNMLSNRFGLEPKDIYIISWMIEYHLPWGYKKPTKINPMIDTACVIQLDQPQITFCNVLSADTWGRLSDDAASKRETVNQWLTDFQNNVKQQESKCSSEYLLASVNVKNIQPFVEDFLTKHLTKSKQDTTQRYPILYVPIAPSAAGKSTAYNNFNSVEIFSWDLLRLEWYDSNYSIAWKKSTQDKKFVSKANSVFLSIIKSKKDVYVDNTNLTPKTRRAFIDQAKQKGYKIVGILMPCAIDDVITRQHSRDKCCPISGVEQQYYSLRVPQFGEFDCIIISRHNLY